MTVQDQSIKNKVLRAISLQEQGCFIADYRKELPLPWHKELVELRYSRAWDDAGRYYDYETVWGKFSYDSETRSILVLRQGDPPEQLVPQPRLSLATAALHTGYISVHNNGSSFELDFKTRDHLNWETLRLVNETLRDEHLPVAVWEIDQPEGETPPVIRIANDSAMLFASSAIWSPDDQQLVAVHVVSTSQELLKAVKATLATNNGKGYISVQTPDDGVYLKAARRGYIHVSNSLVNANAEGTATALLHPLTGDPQANPSDYFYLVIPPVERLAQSFIERLDLAIPWPIQADWADYLLESGQETGLVQVLPACGDDFSTGLRVVKNETQWHQVISDGLKNGRIQIS